MNPSLEFSQKFVVGYNAACKPLCQELKLPQTALDILLFLVNNPEYKTASDIVRHALVQRIIAAYETAEHSAKNGLPGQKKVYRRKP